MELTARHRLKIAGGYIAAGQAVNVEDKDEADRLVASGAAEPRADKAKAEKPAELKKSSNKKAAKKELDV